MKLKSLIKEGLQYLQNQEIDLTTRMLFFLEYAAFFASIVGTVVMAAITPSFTVLIPNFVLLFCFGLGLYLSHAKKKYNLASVLLVCGGDFIALTIMFFTAGGNRSGMPIWFLFGVAFTCMMIRGKILKIIMAIISVVIASTSMLLAYYHPELIKPLENSQAEFVDMYQSFLIVSVILCSSLMMYLYSYDKQRQLLEMKSQELKKAVNTDIMTGISNRHAFYEDTVEYSDKGYKENLVLATVDINGLKWVNDNKGHAEGDVLIKNSAEILNSAFSEFGNIYRIGGDEFAARLFCTNDQSDTLASKLQTETEKFNGKNHTQISLAIGTAVWNRCKEKSFFDLEKLADTSMYQNKNQYYQTAHIDRRRV